MNLTGSESARLQAVKAHASELIEIARTCGASDVALCGSVARGEDRDDSDIDFLVGHFDGDDGSVSRARADEMVKAFRECLHPFRVDLRPLPGWLLGPEHHAAMTKDAIPLASLI
ncbi:nucleotidyltransferase family protein [Nocardioides sp.]|uniref:nucleotidyltransferase family protein n=1 Tax=Nocardioides sp. TaxID=35761 RepID=UPI0037830FAE